MDPDAQPWLAVVQLFFLDDDDDDSLSPCEGSVLHELGHCFDLGHTAEGVMARGFDDLDLYFTLSPGG